MNIYNITLLLLIINTIQGFNPFHFTINKYNIGKIRIIEAEKPQVEALFLPGKFKDSIPSEAYNNFLMNLSNENIKIYIPDKDEDKINELIKKISEDKKNIVIISHSTSSKKALEIATSNSNIKNLILIDPIDTESINLENKLNSFKEESIKKTLEISKEISEKIPIKIEMKNKKNQNKSQIVIHNDTKENTHIDNILVLKSKLSDKWKYIPFIPPIGLYSLNPENYDFDNTNVTIKEFDNYGHFDIIDSPWSDILHNTISQGNKNRGNFQIQSHQKLLAKIVSGFAKKKM